MEVRHVEGMTYQVGDTSVTAGAPKVTATTGGETKTTGTIEVRVQGSWTSSQAVVYQPASGNNPARRAEPAVAFRETAIANNTVSADSKASLILVDRYVGRKTVWVYRDKALVTAAVTETNPLGAVDHDTNPSTPALEVMRAEGEFYRVSGSGAFTPTATSGDPAPSSVTIATATRDANAGGVGVYYYMHPTNGKTYLRITGTGGPSAIQYQELHVYQATRFPAAMRYEHINFGVWWRHEDDATFGMAKAFVKALPGKGMTGDDMPNLGTATYRGRGEMLFQQSHPEGKGGFASVGMMSETTVDFGKNTIDVVLKADNPSGGNPYDFATLKGRITGNTFSGTSISNEMGRAVATPLGLKTSRDGGVYTGTFSGAFFGPQAPEVGGVYDYTSEGGKAGAFRGSFGGRKQ